MSGYKEKVAFPRGGEESLAGGGARKRKVIDIVDNTLAPPNPEVLGDRYILDGTGGGVNANWDGASAWDLVEFNGTTWVAYTPEEGWVTYVDILNVDYRFIDDGTPQWELASTTVTLQAAYDGGEEIQLAVATPITVQDSEVAPIDLMEIGDSLTAPTSGGPNTPLRGLRFVNSAGLSHVFQGEVNLGGPLAAVSIIRHTPAQVGGINAILNADGNDVVTASTFEGLTLGSGQVAVDTAAGLGIKIFDASGTGTKRFNVDGSTGDITTIGDIKTTAGRVQQKKGIDIASANDLTLGQDGNVFSITGTTQINAITTTDWQAGSQITLVFTGATTVKHATAGGAGTAQLFLAGSVDFVAAANSVLGFVYDGTQWQETFRAAGGLVRTYTAKTANYTLTAADDVVECTTNSFTITLPTAVGIQGRCYTIKNSGATTITVDANGTETIDGSLTIDLIEDETITVLSNNVGWLII